MWSGNNFFMNGHNKYRTIRAFNLKLFFFVKHSQCAAIQGTWK